jgi:hypothetical protein
MIYKFKSQAAAEVIMLQANAEDLLKIIGKPPDATGIITCAQIPGALRALQQEIARREAAGQGAFDDEQQPGAELPPGTDDGISLRRRAAPFLDLLRQSAAAGKDVVWGV